jgi:hypothetical protein
MVSSVKKIVLVTSIKCMHENFKSLKTTNKEQSYLKIIVQTNSNRKIMKEIQLTMQMATALGAKQQELPKTEVEIRKSRSQNKSVKLTWKIRRRHYLSNAVSRSKIH